MSQDIFPLAIWPENAQQARLPANDNALRMEVALSGAIGITDDEPIAPSERDQYIVGTPWGGFAEDSIVIYLGATWLEFVAPIGMFKSIGSDLYNLTEVGWAVAVSGGGGGGTIGKQAIYIAAAAMSPSAAVGCAALAIVATSANQPDLQTLNFDTTTQEFAQFSFVMPRKWNEGTVTFKAHWSHPSTSTNFGVAWQLQAVAVGDDDAIASAYGTEQVVTDTGGTTNDLYSTAESSAITVGGSPQAEDMVFFRVARVPSNGSDTLAVDARLHGITLYITTESETDA
ncbi:MAG: hypothetical protein IBJ14_05060 [Hydrogenophaga sp.]|nr:hypothetical protein [Hydrogenophaga sp.]